MQPSFQSKSKPSDQARRHSVFHSYLLLPSSGTSVILHHDIILQEILVFISLLSPHLCPSRRTMATGSTDSDRNEYQESSWG
jgi:hypothetical protein